MNPDTLIVMLPGALMTPPHFVAAGFYDAMAQAPFAADLHVADYDTERLDVAGLVREMLPMLHRSVIRPARGRYRHIVLGGISLGGMLALQYVRRYPGSVDGLCLLAPYPGNGLITGPIIASGGLEHWQPGAEEMLDPEFQLWQWLAKDPLHLPIYLGYGDEDRFVPGMAMMAAAMPRAQIHVVPGGHDFNAWRQLWEDFLIVGLGQF